MSKEKKEKIERLPSATDDCADVTSRYERYKKDNNQGYKKSWIYFVGLRVIWKK